MHNQWHFTPRVHCLHEDDKRSLIIAPSVCFPGRHRYIGMCVMRIGPLSVFASSSMRYSFACRGCRQRNEGHEYISSFDSSEQRSQARHPSLIAEVPTMRWRLYRRNWVSMPTSCTRAFPWRGEVVRWVRWVVGWLVGGWLGRLCLSLISHEPSASPLLGRLLVSVLRTCGVRLELRNGPRCGWTRWASECQHRCFSCQLWTRTVDITGDSRLRALALNGRVCVWPNLHSTVPQGLQWQLMAAGQLRLHRCITR
jgi:hypothetical protein